MLTTQGSDHCPVYAVINSKVSLNGESVHIKDLMNPPGMFEQGQRKIEWTTKDLLPFSGKLLTEFDRRRSIRDMFRKQTPAQEDTTILTSTIPPRKTTNPETKEVEDASIDGQSSEIDKLATPSKIIPSDCSLNVARNSTPVQHDSPPPSKRRKQYAGTKDSNPVSSNQKSLKAFFQPKVPKKNVSSLPSPADSQLSRPSKPSRPSPSSIANNGVSMPFNYRSNNQDGVLFLASPSLEAGAEPRTNDLDFDSATATEKIIDPEETKVGWTKIFSKRDPPRCEGHNEPCISLETKKKGVNCGRRFWICPR
jgi:AP endonuclease-2